MSEEASIGSTPMIMKVVMAIGVMLLIVSAWLALRPTEAPVVPNGPLPRSTFVVGSGAMRSALDLEVASTPEQQRRGLMARDDVAGDGMAFRMADEPASFWMRGTRIPLDIAFVSPGGTILNVERGNPNDETPIPSAGRVRLVIEVPAGRARLLGLTKGATVREDRNAPLGE